MIQKGRITARMEGDFALFLLGVRINQPMKVHKWLPPVMAMRRMLNELYRRPKLGFLHHEMWLSRTIIVVQYWRSPEQLLDYASNIHAKHLSAWHDFNKAAKNNPAVGIWHETYPVTHGNYENIYIHMPPFGLGKASALSERLVGDEYSPSAQERLTKNNAKASETPKQ